jgi:hippurate hydrolase
MAALAARIRLVATNTAAALGLHAEVTIDSELPPTSNHRDEAALAAAAAAASGMTVRRDMSPTMGAEDFGRFLLAIPGAYAWIGNGDSAGLHNPGYDYNDAILPVAARYYAAVARSALA